MGTASPEFLSELKSLLAVEMKAEKCAKNETTVFTFEDLEETLLFFDEKCAAPGIFRLYRDKLKADLDFKCLPPLPLLKIWFANRESMFKTTETDPDRIKTQDRFSPCRNIWGLLNRYCFALLEDFIVGGRKETKYLEVLDALGSSAFAIPMKDSRGNFVFRGTVVTKDRLVDPFKFHFDESIAEFNQKLLKGTNVEQPQVEIESGEILKFETIRERNRRKRQNRKERKSKNLEQQENSIPSDESDSANCNEIKNGNNAYWKNQQMQLLNFLRNHHSKN